MAQRYDLIVVGAGPAGSVAAYHAAKSGAKTLILERLPLPRYKTCAGFVSPWVIKHYNVPEEVIDRFCQAWALFPSMDSKPITIPLERRAGLVMRSKFDHYLTRLAMEAGAELKSPEPVHSLIIRDGVICGVRTHRANYESCMVIGADGAGSIVARRAGFWEIWFRDESWRKHTTFNIQYELQVRNEMLDDLLGNQAWMFSIKEIIPMGYAWIFPKDGIATLGIGAWTPNFRRNPKHYLDEFIRSQPIASKLWNSASKIYGPRGGFLPMIHPFRPSYAPGVILVGDACGHVSPITGEGIFFGVRAGEIAGKFGAEAVSHGWSSREDLAEYERRWNEVIGIHLDKHLEIRESSRRAGEELDALKMYAELFRYTREYISRKQAG